MLKSECRSGFKPFMEYAGSYALFNWQLNDPKLGMDYDNLRLIRAFEHGLDPKSSEAGFVLIHVDMVRRSGKLVEGAIGALKGCGNTDREAFNTGLEMVVEAMTEVNGVMDGMYLPVSGCGRSAMLRLLSLQAMWKKSKPNDYNSFRTFIFGITKQTMFPHGVVYEGVSKEPMSFRGESGANDSMVSRRPDGIRVIKLTKARYLCVTIYWRLICLRLRSQKFCRISDRIVRAIIANSWNGSKVEQSISGSDGMPCRIDSLQVSLCTRHGWLELTDDYSTVSACSEPGTRLSLAPLVLYTRVHLEEDSTSDCYRRKPHRISKAPISQKSCSTTDLSAVASEPAFQRVQADD